MATNTVTVFHKECEDLVGATLVRTINQYFLSFTFVIFQHLSWADQEQEVVELYIDYLSDLFSAQI